MACRFLEYCGKNNATVDVERKEKVVDIADTLRGLDLLPRASSGKERCLSLRRVKLKQNPHHLTRSTILLPIIGHFVKF